MVRAPKASHPIHVPSQQNPIQPCPGLMSSSMSMVESEPKCLINLHLLPTTRQLRLLLFSHRSEPRSFFKCLAPSLTHATMMCPTSSASLLTTLSSPTRWFGLSYLDSGKERPNTSGVVDEDARIMVRMMASIQATTRSPRSCCLQGFAPPTCPFPIRRCYTPMGPILSWRFVPPRPITTRPSVVQVKEAQPESPPTANSPQKSLSPFRPPPPQSSQRLNQECDRRRPQGIIRRMIRQIGFRRSANLHGIYHRVG